MQEKKETKQDIFFSLFGEDEEWLENKTMDNLVEIQMVLAEQIACFKKIINRKSVDIETRKLAEDLIVMTEKEYWSLDNKIDEAREANQKQKRQREGFLRV